MQYHVSLYCTKTNQWTAPWPHLVTQCFRLVTLTRLQFFLLAHCVQATSGFAYALPLLAQLLQLMRRKASEHTVFTGSSWIILYLIHVGSIHERKNITGNSIQLTKRQGKARWPKPGVSEEHRPGFFFEPLRNILEWGILWNIGIQLMEFLSSCLCTFFFTCRCIPKSSHIYTTHNHLPQYIRNFLFSFLISIYQ